MKISLRNFLITFFVSILFFGVAAYFISTFVTATLTDSIDGNPAVSLDIITQPIESEVDSEQDDIFANIKGDSFNFVIIGTDYQPDLFNDYEIEDSYTDTFPEKRNRIYSADAIAVIRFDKEGRKILISSIPSNMRLKVDGSFTMLGDIYRENGLEFFLDKLTGLTGFDIDKYFVIDVADLAPLVDILDGVDFYVPENMSYTDPSQDLTIDLKKGKQHIDGEAAEQLLRFNDYKDTSNSREKTACDFILALADKISDVSYIQKAVSLFTAFDEYITTNYTLEDLADNLDVMAHYQVFEKVTNVYPGKQISVGKEQYYDPDIKDAIGEYAKYR